MRILVIDTTSPCLSVALFDDGQLLNAFHERIGRGHAEQLLPVIAQCADGGRADQIWVGCGPGSFTGTRIGIAAAKALGFAWGARVTGYDSMALLAAQVQRLSGAQIVAVASEGGHGEWLVADGPDRARALSPAIAASTTQADVVGGDCAAALVAARGRGTALAADVDAREALALGTDAFLASVEPVYARAPDAVSAAMAAPA